MTGSSTSVGEQGRQQIAPDGITARSYNHIAQAQITEVGRIHQASVAIHQLHLLAVEIVSVGSTVVLFDADLKSIKFNDDTNSNPNFFKIFFIISG